MAKDHYMAIAGTDADHGEHSKVTLRVGAAPTQAADKGMLYAKDVSAKAELFYRDEDGDEVQLTDAGKQKTDLETIFELIYPIGSIYISIVDTDPNTLFGYGTWAAFGTGRTLVGIDATDTDFDTVEETGGEKTHALIEAELAEHDHAGLPVNSSATVVGTDTTGYWRIDSNVTTGKTGKTGSGTAHNNLQPYIVVYMWKRTA